MKHFKLFSTFLAALLISSAAIFNACSKQETSEPLTTGEQPELSSADQLILTKIKNFKQTMDVIRENPGYKSGESMSVDSAVWYIGAVLNYNYSRAGHPFEKIHRDTSYLEMEILNGPETMYEEVVASYDACLSRLSQNYYGIENESKKLILASVKDNGTSANGNEELLVVIMTGTGTPASDDFGEDDAYLFNRDATQDCYYGLPAQGAPLIFESYLNSYYNPEPTPDDWRWTFIGPETVVTFNYQDYVLNNPKTNYLDYKIFAASQSVSPITGVTECLEWDQEGSGIHEMQFYYDYLIELIDEELNGSYLSYSPASRINSGDRTTISVRTIWHAPEIHLQMRLTVYTVPTDPPFEY